MFGWLRKKALAVVHPTQTVEVEYVYRWQGTRTAVFAAGEVSGKVAQRFAQDQGLPHTYRFQGLDPYAPIPSSVGTVQLVEA